MVSAQTKMKTLVVSRLLLGDIPNWQVFEAERKTAGEIFKSPYRKERFFADWPQLP